MKKLLNLSRVFLLSLFGLCFLAAGIGPGANRDEQKRKREVKLLESSAKLQGKQRRAFGRVLLILVFTVTTMLGINIYTQFRSVEGRMGGEVDQYYNKAKEWVAENRVRAHMISRAFSAQPWLAEDHEKCARFLGGIARDYNDISVAYIANPAWSRQIITNTGCKPAGKNWRIEERPWYSEAIKSDDPDGFNITAPYRDIVTGLYCVTMSQIVRDLKGNFIGVLGIDYRMDKLASILGVGNDDDGYAFLVDRDFNIINHPNSDYHITADSSVNAKDLCYREALVGDKSVLIKDYDGVYKLCRMKKEKVFGFSVILVKTCTSMYSYMFMSGLHILLTFGLCIFIVVSTMKKLNLVHMQVQKELADAAEAATAASHAKDDFLANMSHEIRTPMNSVLGMTELILRERDASNTIKDYCYNIQNSGRNLLAIINDILDFSKIESGKLELVAEEFNIASTLNDVINMAVTRIGERDLQLVVLADPDIPIGLIGDEIRIRQVIINLVTNAVKYTREGGVFIKVRLLRDENGSTQQQDGKILLCVEVTDTGIGISEKDMGKLFNSFQQLDTKKNRAIEGTGLGLAISKRLSEQMGGSLSVDSTYGKGSTFGFRVPLKVANETHFLSVKNAAAVHAALYFDLTRYKVPEAGDYYRMALKALPRQLGIDLDIFCSPEELKQRAEQKPYTHIFIGNHEYFAQEEIFRDISNFANHPELIIVQRRGSDELNLPGAKCIYEPFCTLSLVAELNDEPLISHSNESAFAAKFIAPRAKVLIVDDNSVNLVVAEGLMRPYKMHVFLAASAAEAITLLKECKDINIIFMDHMMPEVDGVEATGIIRAMDDDYYKTVPVIALTANAISGAKEQFLSAGMNDFIAKPIDPKVLDRVIRKWLPKSLMETPVESEDDSAGAIAAEAIPEGDDTFSPKVGLGYAGGSVEVYHDILKSYIGKGPEKSANIRKFYEEKDWKNYVIEVHALKSTSLTIGAKQLSELAKSLEAAGKSSNYQLIDENNEPMLELYAEVLEKGEKYLSPFREETIAMDAADLPEIAKEKVAEWIEKIIKACDDFNAEPLKDICVEASEYACQGVALKPLFEEILAAVKDFEFDEAAQKAQAIKEKFNQL